MYFHLHPVNHSVILQIFNFLCFFFQSIDILSINPNWPQIHLTCFSIFASFHIQILAPKCYILVQVLTARAQVFGHEWGQTLELPAGRAAMFSCYSLWSQSVLQPIYKHSHHDSNKLQVRMIEGNVLNHFNKVIYCITSRL